MSARAAGWLDALARRRAVWALVLVAALAARLAFVFTAPAGIPWKDGRVYEAAGWTLASEHRYTAGPYYPPGYIVFIAGVYALTGHDLRALRLTEAVLSTATVGLIGAFGAMLLGPGAGLLAAALAATHPVLAFLPITHYVENLLLALAAIAFGVFGSALRRPTAPRFAAAGALLGLALLCKPALVAVLPGFAAGALWTLGRCGVGRLVGWGALFTLALALVVAPWIVRQRRVDGGWFFITAGGGKQFWMGNNPGYAGSTESNPRPSPALDAALASRRTRAEQDRFLYAEGRRYIREHPWTALRNYLLKLRNLWALYPRTQTRTRYSIPAADLAQAVASLVLYLGAVMGLARLGTAGLSAFALGIVTYTLTISMYLTVMRYRLGIEVLLLWLAGAGWAAMLQRGDARSRPGAASAGSLS